jgi:ribosomal protein L37E
MRTNLIINETQKLTCLRCGRDKFIRKTPHKCPRQYRKRKIRWGIKIIGIGLWKIKEVDNNIKS